MPCIYTGKWNYQVKQAKLKLSIHFRGQRLACGNARNRPNSLRKAIRGHGLGALKPAILRRYGGRIDCGSRSSRVCGGETGIRTLGTLTGTPHFECGAFDHSAISPQENEAPGRMRSAPLAEAPPLAKPVPGRVEALPCVARAKD